MPKVWQIASLVNPAQAVVVQRLDLPKLQLAAVIKGTIAPREELTMPIHALLALSVATGLENKI